MQEKMDNVSREMETLGKNQKEVLEVRNTVTVIRKDLDGFIIRLDTAKKKKSVSLKYINRNIQN